MIETVVAAPIKAVWKAWITPSQITQWNAATDNWCCPSLDGIRFRGPIHPDR
jgi:uncharacterized protein YndB with AHSA1/START domain